MKRKIAQVFLAVFLAAVLLMGCGEKTQVRFGAAGEGGTYYAYGTAAAEIVQKTGGIAFDVKATAGSAANIRLLSEGYLQMAIAQSDVIADAWNGQGAFEGDARTGYRTVASLYTEYCQIVVRADSDIQTVEDLSGKVVSLGETESGAELNAEQILQCCGLNLSLLQVRNYGYKQAAQALKSGEIDAFFCTAGLPMDTIRQLAEEVSVRLLPLSDRQAERLVETYGGYTRCTIPAGTYAGQTEDVHTVGVRAVLLASEKLSDQVVEKVFQALLDHTAEVNNVVGMETGLSGTTETPVPYHNGVVEYYKENADKEVVG